MNILQIEVDGFGVWNGLRLSELTGQANVFFGPNEAGKTTLLEFVRSVLYGFHHPARRGYLPPPGTAGYRRAGGALEVAGPGGRYLLSRHAAVAPDGSLEEHFRLLSADGALAGDEVLDLLLGGVDEATFNNVFAVGLREIQELGSLSDTAAAQFLYRLTTGLDRVSLSDVQEQLAASRHRLLAADGRGGLVAGLLARREQLLRGIDELRTACGRYVESHSKRQQLEEQIASLQSQSAELEHGIRVVEAAIAVRQAWRRRESIDKELSALADAPPLPSDALVRLQRAVAAIARLGRRSEKLRREMRTVRSQSAALGLNSAIARHAPRIEALAEQETWLATLETRVGELESGIETLEARLAAEQAPLAGQRGKLHPKALERAIASLRPAAAALNGPRKRLREARGHEHRARRKVEAAEAQIKSALAGRSETELTPALERAGGLVAQLRRRLQLDERLDQMNRHQVELETQCRQLLEHQLLPAWVLAGLGGLFALGVVLILTGLFLPASLVGSAGWALSLLGVCGAAGSAAAKFLLERSAARRLEACRKQAGTLALQIKQAREERESLDRQLPRGGGPLVMRLQAAEKELASLEELLSLDARRQMADQEATAAAARAGQARREARLARRRWRQALAEGGLPDGLSPLEARGLVRRCRVIDELTARLDVERQEYEARRRELDILAGRLAQVLADVGVAPSGEKLLERLRQLRGLFAEHQVLAGRREALRQRQRRLRRLRVKLDRSLSRWQRRRQKLLQNAGVSDEAEFRRRCDEQGRAESLRRERDALAREIAAAVGSRLTEEEVGQCLVEWDADLEARWDELTGLWQALEQPSEELLATRGRLEHEIQALAGDRRLASSLLDLGMVERQLAEAIERWQVLAVTEQVLDAVRRMYEMHRQPATLEEASRYLERMTEGHYVRVWTPLEAGVLRVDDAAGGTLPVESLSRGTREQLFLSLRLALAGSYVRRGVQLPLVLDDVLVNFDSRRAKAAVALLRDFAAAGNQVFVFTCHDHVERLFKASKVPTRRLPAHTAEPVVSLESPSQESSVEEEPAGIPFAPTAGWSAFDGGGQWMQVEEEGEEWYGPAAATEFEDSEEPDDDDLETEASDANRSNFLDEEDAHAEDADQEKSAWPSPSVSVVRGRFSDGPFANAMWHEPVEDDLADQSLVDGDVQDEEEVCLWDETGDRHSDEDDVEAA